MGIWVYIEVLNFDTDLTYIIPNCRFSLGVLKKQPMSDKVLKTLWSDLGHVSVKVQYFYAHPDSNSGRF